MRYLSVHLAEAVATSRVWPQVLRHQQIAQQNMVELRCPMDRSIVDRSKVFIDLAMERLVGGFQVKCIHDGCS